MIMKTFTKRAEVIEHFVANGIHAAIAKALVTEYYDYGNYNSNPDYKEEGLLQRINEFGDVCEAVTLTEEEADQFFASNGGDFAIEVVNGVECITFDGEPMCDLEGNLL